MTICHAFSQSLQLIIWIVFELNNQIIARIVFCNNEKNSEGPNVIIWQSYSLAFLNPTGVRPLEKVK